MAAKRGSTKRASATRTRKAPFGPGLMRFLKELQANNTRDWFAENKERYETHVREPALAFIRAMEKPLEKISPHFVASDRKVGGSLMRVHRDVRFSKDKSPYKTNLGIQFRHESGKDVHAPGFYLHVDPTNVFLGAGMWHPDASALKAMREAIDADGAAWKRASRAKRLRDNWELAGDSLKRAPKGYPIDHPLIEDLRRKDHIAVCNLKKSDVTRADLVTFLAQRFRDVRSYMAFQAEALGLPF